MHYFSGKHHLNISYKLYLLFCYWAYYHFNTPFQWALQSVLIILQFRITPFQHALKTVLIILQVGLTPFQQAVQNSNLELAEYLLLHGANVQITIKVNVIPY